MSNALTRELSKLFHHIGEKFESGDCDDLSDEERLRMLDLAIHMADTRKEEREHKHERIEEVCELLARDVKKLREDVSELKHKKKLEKAKKTRTIKLTPEEWKEKWK